MPGLTAFLLGTCLGSFLNVVAYRLPRDQSLIRPRSRCPSCGGAIGWRDNVPVVSWFALGGRCRRCRKAISPRYPAVEASMGILTAALWQRWGADPLWAAMTVAACGGLAAVALIDWDTMLIPDELSLGLLGAGIAGSPLSPFYPGGAWYWDLGRSLLGAAAGFGLCWGTAVVGEAIFKKEAMGGGDIKLMTAVGAWTGALGAFDCLMVGSFFGSIYGVGLILRGRLGRADPIPFGPFLAGGALLNFFHLLPLGFPFSGL